MKTEKSIRSLARDIDTFCVKEGVGVKISQDKDGNPILHAHNTTTIKTVEDLLKACNVDTEVYEVARGEVNKWDQMSADNGLVEHFQVKARLRRKTLSNEEILNTFKNAAAVYKNLPKVPKAKVDSSTLKDTMVEFALPDLHLGKLAWDKETRHGNWNVDRAVEAWKNAVNDLVARAPKASEAWFVLGNDFFNVDNQDETTTGGTPQDEDGRWAQTFQRGLDLLHETIAKLAQKFPKVKIIVVPGNHDSQRAWYLGAALQEYYRGAKADNIEIDNRPDYRKYYQWGDTGIGFAHGDRLKANDLGNLCQNEARQIWGNTKRFELHLGHLHQNMVRSIGGVTVRWLPALCPPDAWHAKSGYTMSEKAAMLFEYNKQGLKQIMMHYPADSIFE